MPSGGRLLPSTSIGGGEAVPGRGVDALDLDAAAMERVVAALNAIRMNDPDRLGDWFGRFITTYRAAGEVVARGDERPRIELEWDLAQGASLQRHPASRLAWRRKRRGASLFCSGLALDLPVADARLLAACGQLDQRSWEALSAAGREAAFALYQAGHYALLADDPDAD